MGSTSSKESKYYPDFVTKIPSLEGKTVAVTGCTSGTGLVFAKTCCVKGAAKVLLLNRPSERATKAHEDIEASIPPSGTTKVQSIDCDLQDFSSVRKAAEVIRETVYAIDILCNNAGVMALEDKATKDGYDVQMQTNHLSHFLLTKELFPLLERAHKLRGQARVVQHSSVARGMTGGKDLQAPYLEKKGGDLGGNSNSMFCGGARWVRYQQTKLANAVFMIALADRLEATGSGIISAAAAPGLAATQLQVTANESGGIWGNNIGMMMWMAQSSEDGTMPLLAACFDESTQNGDFWEPQDMSRLRGPAIKVELEKTCTNEESRTMLWEKSEEACGKFEMK